MDCSHAASLYQHVKEPTRIRLRQRPSTLDLVFTRQESEISDLRQEVPLGKSVHNVLLLETCITKEKPPRRWCRNFGRMNIEDLSRDAQTRASVDQRSEKIRDQLIELTEKHAPLQPRGDTHKPQRWKSTIKRAIGEMARRWKAFVLTRGHDRWLQYKKVRNYASKLGNQAKMAFEVKIANRARQEPKTYYSYVQPKTALRQSVGNLENTEGRSWNTACKLGLPS
ncbi:unnamed protein product [Echinostoma caproni]|uniref:Reverse transcriptase n=1 Tax=Echinostoma caproni TaxID=27848 RepID=A0A183BE31_9TREM|nr:unnamed protein product [Echinostoma caproni]